MKSTVNILCPRHLLEVTAASHPLLNDIWGILEKIHKSGERESIYRNFHGKMVSTKKNNVQTELGVFLDLIYSVDMRAGFQDTIDVINRIPDNEEKLPEWQDCKIKKIKQVLLNYVTVCIDHIKDYNFDLHGDFKIKISSTTIEFKDFQPFRKKILELSKKELKQNKIPSFSIDYHFAESFEVKIKHFAEHLRRYLEHTDNPKCIGELLFEMYEVVQNYEYMIHHSYGWLLMANKEIKLMDSKEEQLANNPILIYYQKLKADGRNLSFRGIAEKFFTKKPKIYRSKDSAVAALKAAVARTKPNKKRAAMPTCVHNQSRKNSKNDSESTK